MQSLKPTIQADIQAGRYRLAVLMGRRPEDAVAGLDKIRPLPITAGHKSLLDYRRISCGEDLIFWRLSENWPLRLRTSASPVLNFSPDFFNRFTRSAER